VGPDVAIRWELPAFGRSPSDAARHSLAEWAEARGIHLAPSRRTPAVTIKVDETLAAGVEEELERARDAIAALDTRGTEMALRAADATLDAHPELPEAAWLRGEVARSWATRWRRLSPRDGARADAEWARAAGLGGDRAAGVGEARSTALAPTVTATMAGGGAGEAAGEPRLVRLDGVVVAGSSLTASPGEHQLTVTSDGATVWAGWVTVEAGSVVRVATPQPGACTSEDLSRAHRVDGAVVATSVLCGTWVFARELPESPGELSLATCEGDHCGAPFRWKVGAPGPVLPPSHASMTHWPVWATWAVLGASAVAIGAGTLAAAGVFRPTHDEPMFSTGKLRMSSTPIRLPLGE
jgi:hypothetical protein